MTHRLARLTERRDYYSEGATDDRSIAFDPNLVTVVLIDSEPGKSDPAGAWVHLKLDSGWEGPAEWESSQTNGVFLTREPYADVLREIDCALRGATRVSAVTLATPLSDLELSVRVRHCTSRLGLRTVGELCDRSAAELMDVTNFGATCLREVREKLGALGLSLRGEESR